VNIVFAGTPDIAVPALESAVSCANVVAVLTNPDRSSGRGRKVAYSPVKEFALDKGLKVMQPEKLDSAFRDELAELEPDLLISFAYGKIFGPRTLDMFKFGGINIHPSLLPLYRGPAPINAAIINLDTHTGITIQKLAEEMDSGDILLQQKFPLNYTETTESLSRIVSFMSSEMLVEVLNHFHDLYDSAKVQDESQATYCSLLKKEDGLIDWTVSSRVISAKVRGYNPWPGCFTFVDGIRLNIIEAVALDDEESGIYKEKYSSAHHGKVVEINKRAGIIVKAGEGFLAVTRLQLHSKKVLDYKSFNNGYNLTDKVLGN
jgi:methionyl-tRNA formyltransferase